MALRPPTLGPGPEQGLGASPQRAGLLGSTALTPPTLAAAQAPVPPAVGIDAQPAAAPEEEPNVSGEEQAEYDELVDNAYKVLYTNLEATLEGIAGGGDPATGLGTVVGATLSRLVDSAAKVGKRFREEVVLNAGVELTEQLADLAKTADLHDFTPDELETAVLYAAEYFRSQQQEDGMVDPNTAAADLDAMEQAEATGSLDDYLPDRLGGGIEDAVPTPAAKPPASPLARTGLVA